METEMKHDSDKLRAELQAEFSDAKYSAKKRTFYDCMVELAPHYPNALNKKQNGKQPSPHNFRRRSVAVVGSIMRGENITRYNRALVAAALVLYRDRHVKKPTLPLFDSGSPKAAEEVSEKFSPAVVFSFGNLPLPVVEVSEPTMTVEWREFYEAVRELRDRLDWLLGMERT